jgi:hypothetical protein
MTTKERILHELDQLDEEELEILYQLIEQFLTARQQEITEPSFLERLAKIQIDGPVDFAENIDLYLTGEKQIDPDLYYGLYSRPGKPA